MRDALEDVSPGAVIESQGDHGAAGIVEAPLAQLEELQVVLQPSIGLARGAEATVFAPLLRALPNALANCGTRD